MGSLVEEIINYLKSEDILDLLYTYAVEHIELLCIVIAFVFIMVLCLWTMLERLQKRGWIALIPIYRFIVLFKAVGISPWLVILMLIPGVNLIMRTVFYVFIARRFDRSYWMGPGLLILPLVFLPIVSFGDGTCPHIRIPKQKRERKNRAPLTQESKAETDKKEIPLIETSSVTSATKKPEEKGSTVKNNNKTEPPRVLAMAELKQKRADRMPSMKQGPKGKDIARQKAKAQKVQEGEYAKLLRQQQVAQKKRAEKKTVDGVIKKRQTSPSPHHKP